MYYIKLFAKNEKELETLIQAVRIYSHDIGMEFGIERCTMLIIKSGKWQMMDGIELPNQEKIRTLREKETYKYLEYWKLTPSNKQRWKKKNKKEYLRKIRNLLETKLYCKFSSKGCPPCKILGIILIAEQNNAIKTNYVKGKIGKTQRNSKCRLWDNRDETINQVNAVN